MTAVDPPWSLPQTRAHVTSWNSSDTGSIRLSRLQTSSPANLQLGLSIGNALGSVGRTAIYQQLFKHIRLQAHRRADGFSTMTKVNGSCRTGLTAGLCAASPGTLHLAGKVLAWGIWPGDTGSPAAADLHLDLALLALPATGGLVGSAMQQARRCGDREPRGVWETIQKFAVWYQNQSNDFSLTFPFC